MLKSYIIRVYEYIEHLQMCVVHIIQANNGKENMKRVQCDKHLVW